MLDEEDETSRPSFPSAAAELPVAPDDRLKGTTLTVVVAAGANVAVAAAKVVAGVITGSAAMQAEAVHSAADTITEAFLFVATRRGARAPDPMHPLGHGRETYLWAFLAALATFVVGAGFALVRGVEIVLHGEKRDANSLVVPVLVLLFAFAMDGASLRRAMSQVRAGAQRAGMPARRYLRVTSDTAVKAIILEDTAALAGLVIASAGLGLWRLTGDPTWDGGASVIIGLLLVVVAVTLAATNLSLLTGRAASEPLQSALRTIVESVPGVEAVPVFIALILGPGNLVIAAKVHFEVDYSAADIERVADEAEERLRARFPGVRYVFLDPTGWRDRPASPGLGSPPRDSPRPG
jgi:cation diffusion facilitator family transporter